ncbi:trehalose 6-phosphatase [Motilibacter rhizosphaerae]|uniref:Trehalose 6-phosphate phosphatase n=1 Tax=Motilibacter rhizosphaerae TaxID=598652 RepID=A0A4Q7NQJ3_9ACTN|nr:trehalose-phosphatase [Motilibacter rhizosphaerae]RZS87569.1 trehalose 6-phosphatase [Motilibacter rhizosphaerae]
MALDAATPAGRAGLAALLADPRRAIVGLDFDGTLAPIVDDPAQARAHPDALPALQALAPLLGRVAVVTGRPAALAVELVGLAGARGLEHVTVLGAYGRERWDAATGEVQAPPEPPAVAAARAEVAELLARTAPDAHLEDKPAAVAVHTRRSADPEGAFARLREPVRAVAEAHGLAFEPGRLVLEVRAPGADKGAALRGLLEELGGASALVFVGDDLGDLPAFDEVARQREAGVPGICVCSGSTEVAELAERADVVVDGPAGVAAWLQELAAALDR